MSRGAQTQVSKTRELKRPNEYVLALLQELEGWAFDEEKAPTLKGSWREKAFSESVSTPLDLEIGTGNGVHFAHRARLHPERSLIGIELKYKPLVQAIRRARRADSKNARILRYNAVHVDHIFADQELNDVMIHFPDPWEKLRQNKHRLIQDEFLQRLFLLQRSGSKLEFKTDSRDYFFWAMERFARSTYKILGSTENLHSSAYAGSNFITHFESIFLRQKLPIYYCLLERP